jgi:23S rRNA (cytidine1920-2'-O)/16S rRNA (cytidine1409-2'-O)-methyltransferase
MNSFHRRTTRAASTAPATRQPVERHGLLRLDALLVSQGLAPSRTAAQRLIGAGKVLLDGKVLNKAALELPPDSRLTVNDADETRYVSRGALKLAGALSATGIVVSGKNCLDIGQSTGGFSDCLLQAGASHVVGVDVGHGQLHGKLKNDPRISALEGINCRQLSADDLGTHLPPQGFDLIVGDVSFISMRLILPQLPALLNDAGDLLLLIKPQFEVGPDGIGKGGIVRNTALYQQVERTFIDLARILQLTVKAWLDSPITGGDGNREFFIWLTK